MADEKTPRDRKTLALQILDLGEHRLRVNNHSIAHHASFVFVHNPRGDHVEDKFGISHDYRVTGIRPPLITHHHIGFERVIVDNLRLAHVAPQRT